MSRYPTFIPIFGGAVLCAGAAQASPPIDYACYAEDYVATVSVSTEGGGAYLRHPTGAFELPDTGASPAFNYDNGTYRFSGFQPEATLFDGDNVAARCWQTADSQKTLALYGADTNGQWSDYIKQTGKASGNIRAMPSSNSERVASFADRTDVAIIKNTDEFMDGFFWYHIQFGGDKRGYIWGALLCYDGDEVELSSTLRQCN